jgi:L-ornithine Nalpha-acyltransferase
MMIQSPTFAVRLARDEGDLLAAQRLRYRVFVQELGGDGPLVDHDLGLERDQFDAAFDHLLLIDPLLPDADQVVGVYRLMHDEGARRLGQFYSEDEYDLTVLRQSGRKLLELGRSCLHPAYRGGTAMYHLWHGLADYIAQHEIEVLFGVASFHGRDPQALAQPLSYLHRHHLAPPELRVRARSFAPMDLLPATAINRRQAMLETPALIKAYLRLGGMVGDGAFVDRAFNTVDVCLVMDIARMNAKQKLLYTTTGRNR